MIPIVTYILISVLLGGISCLFGKKLYFPILMLTVFCTVVTISFSLFELTLPVVIITVIAGVLAALLARFFYKLGVFFLGGTLGACLGLFAVSVLPPAAEKYGWILVLLLMLTAGSCAVKWCGFFIIASTALSGAFSIAAPICFLFVEFRNLQNFIYADGMLSTVANLNQYLNGQFSEENSILLFVVTLVIGLGGFVFQTVTNGRRRNKSGK